MSVAGTLATSLRLDRRQATRLVWAFVISVTVHLLCFGGYEVYRFGERHDWWPALQLPAWMRPADRLALKLAQQPKPAELETERELPLTFVDVNPAQATPEAPKAAKYYSDKNALAANPKPAVESSVPKIEGTQTKIPKTENVPHTQAQPLQPAVTPQPPQKVQTAERAAQPAEATKPKATVAPGDLALTKPAEATQPGNGEAERERPRTIAEALARRQSPPERADLPGEKMQQEGGVQRQSLMSSLDVRATPFGAYDAAIIAAVQNRWDWLLYSGDFARERTGVVVLEFKLNYDGRITDLKVVQNTVGELLGLLCQKAILDPAPYERWPSDMRRMVGANYRDVTFTFYYN